MFYLTGKPYIPDPALDGTFWPERGCANGHLRCLSDRASVEQRDVPWTFSSKEECNTLKMPCSMPREEHSVLNT